MTAKVDIILENYIENHINEEPILLKELRIETYRKTTEPHMISGILQGRLLSLLSKIICPKFILEIGTFTGYATLCLSEGLAENGKILTIDKNLETAYLAEKYISMSEHKDQIFFKKENALEVIPLIKESIDFVFLDADKGNYINYLELLKPKLSRGAIILVDNILWKGKVVENQNDKKTLAIKEFNKIVKTDPELDVVILPIRDGISIIRKK